MTRRALPKPTAASPDELRPLVLRLHAATDMKEFWNAACTLIQKIVAAQDVSLAISLEKARPSMTFNTTGTQTPDQFERAYHASRLPEAEVSASGRKVIRMSDHDAAYHIDPASEMGVRVLRPRQWKMLIAKHARESSPSSKSQPLLLFFGGLLAFWRKRRFAHVLTFLRHHRHGDFSAIEMQRLESVHADVETALLRILKGRQSDAHANALVRTLRDERLPMMVLDWHLRLTFRNPEAIEAARHWHGNDGRNLKGTAMKTLPEKLQLACVTLRDELSRHGQHNLEVVRHQATERRRLLPDDGRAPAAEVIYSKAENMPVDQGHFIIRFAGVSPATESPPTGGFEKLTIAEQAVAEMVAAGKSNSEVAFDLSLSVHTVRSHLRTVFKKLGVQSRVQLANHLRAGNGA